MTTQFTRTLKIALACTSFAIAGAALAQGAQPNPNVSNPALGAGQQSQNGTSMGTTGVPATAPSAMPSTSTGSMSSGSTTMNSRSTGMSSGSTMSNGTSMSSNRPMRRARADRN